MINPLMIASLVGTAASIGSNIWSTSKQSKENAKIREYNLELAKLQNQWNMDQWNRENAYNDPTNQKNRIVSAGLNPDLLYGNGGISNTAASSPSMTSGAAASPMDWSSLANINPVDTYLDAQLKQAQINKLNSETEGQDVQNAILASDAKFRDAWNQGQLDTMYSTIHLQGVQANLSDQHIKESQLRIMKIDSDISLIDAQIKQIYNAIRNDNVRIELDKAFNEANIKKVAASASLDYASAKSISDQLEHIINNLKADYDNKLQQKINLGHEGEILLNQSDEAKFSATIRTFEGWDSDMTFYQNASKFVLQLLHGLSSFIPGAKGIVR